MWKAIHHRKLERVLAQGSPEAAAALRRVVRGTEDVLTSSVFERVAYLPGRLGLELLLDACRPVGGIDVPTAEPIEHSEPWPRWSDGEGSWREPDWVLLTEHRAYVVEAKWGRDVVPTRAQLDEQRRLALELHPDVELVQVVVIQSGAVSAPTGGACLAVTWRRLMRAAERALAASDVPSTRHILGDVVEALAARGLEARFLRSLPALPVRGSLTPLSAVASLPDLPELNVSSEARIDPWT